MNDRMPLDFSDGECPSYSTLRYFVKGGLADPARNSVENHLENCASCLAALEAADRSQDSFEKCIRDIDAHLCEEWGFRRLCATLDAQFPGAQGTPALARRLAILDADLPVILGNYRLVERIGQGAMGVVYRAQHTRLKTWVAVKLLSPSKLETQDAVSRFEQEMEMIGRLPDHPHVVRARDAGEIDQQYFLVMDYVDAVDVNVLLNRQGPLDPPEACEIARQASLALAHAHAHGLIHRDVKPSNLMLTRSGEVKLLDLGLASCRGSELQESEVVGTADYMAPEQWESRARLGPATDIYSLGCTLFKLLVGCAPFARTATNTLAKRHAHRSTPFPCLKTLNPRVPPELSALVQRMTAKNRRERIDSAEEMARLLAPFSEGADLGRIAASVLSEASGALQPAQDATWLDWAATTLRRGKPSRRVFGLALFGLAVAGGGVAIRTQPSRYRLLLGDPANAHWEYDSSGDALTVYAINTVLLAVDGQSEIPNALSYSIKRRDKGVTAGLFFGYQAVAEEGWTTETFHTVEIGSDMHPKAVRFSLREYVVSHSPNGVSSWTHVEKGGMTLPNIPGDSMEQALHLEFENGELRHASCNGIYLTPLVDAAAALQPTKGGPQAFGVAIGTQGSALFKDLRNN